MQVKSIIHEIQQLPLDEKFFVMEQTLQSIKDEELKHLSSPKTYSDYSENTDLYAHLVSEKSLSKEWQSKEDNRWDNLL
jgi:hypothetical protein